MSLTNINIGTVKGDFNNIKSPEENIDSIINIIISNISQADVEIDYSNRSFPSEIQKKIDHNSLKNKRRIVLDYKSYSSVIETAYTVAEKNIVNGKRTSMRLLQNMYFSALEKNGVDAFEPEIDQIRECADEIVEDVIRQLKAFVYASANTVKFKEYIEIGINVVVAHAFVECYVLENPNNATN